MAMKFLLLTLAVGCAASSQEADASSPASVPELEELQRELRKTKSDDPMHGPLSNLMHAINKLPKHKKGDYDPATREEEDPVQSFEEAAMRLKEARSFAQELKDKLDGHKKKGEKDKKKGKIVKKIMKKAAKGAVVAGVALGAGTTAVLVKNVRTQLKVRQAECAFNTVLAAQYVTKAALHIAALTKTCRPVGPDQSYVTSACRANAAGIFATCGLIAAYLSIAASQCAKLSNIKALCAGSIEVLLGGLGKVASAAEIMHGTCGAPVDGPRPGESRGDWQIDRRLQAIQDVPAVDDFGLDTATCVLDVTQVATSLAQFSLAFKESIVNCGIDGVTRDVPILGPILRDVCITQVGLLIYGFGTAASYIAAAVAQCGNTLKLQSMCLAAAEQLVAVTGGLVFVGSAMDAACVRLPPLGPLGPVIVPLTALGRRLKEAVDFGNETMSKEERMQHGLRLLGMQDDPLVTGRDSMYI